MAVGGVLIDERALARALDVVSPDAVATAGVEIPEGVLTGLAGLVPCGRVHITVCRRKPGRRHCSTKSSEIACQSLASTLVLEAKSHSKRQNPFWELPI